MCSSLIMFIQTSFYMPSKYSPALMSKSYIIINVFIFRMYAYLKKHFYYHSKLCCFITKDVSKQENIEIKLFIHCSDIHTVKINVICNTRQPLCS